MEFGGVMELRYNNKIIIGFESDGPAARQETET